MIKYGNSKIIKILTVAIAFYSVLFNFSHSVMIYCSFVDLIISDIMMPGIDGFEFAEAIREQNTQIPILFMSARDDFAAKQKGFKVGIDDYMVKPIEFEELILCVGALMRRANIANSRKITVGKFTLDADEYMQH